MVTLAERCSLRGVLFRVWQLDGECLSSVASPPGKAVESRKYSGFTPCEGGMDTVGWKAAAENVAKRCLKIEIEIDGCARLTH